MVSTRLLRQTGCLMPRTPSLMAVFWPTSLVLGGVCLIQPYGHLEAVITRDARLTAQEVDRITQAIWYAEGGNRAKKPFGVLSVPCEGYSACRAICRRTVVNTAARWKRAGRPGTFLHYLSLRYAPRGARNDPQGLNANWERNVYRHLRRIRHGT